MANSVDIINQLIPTASEEETNWLIAVLTSGVIPLPDWQLLSEEEQANKENDFITTGLEEIRPYRNADGQGLEIFSEDLYSTGLVIVVRAFQRKFKKEEPIILTFATECSSPRLYATGGTSILLHRGQDWCFGAETGAIAKAKELGLSVPEG